MKRESEQVKAKSIALLDALGVSRHPSNVATVEGAICDALMDQYMFLDRPNEHPKGLCITEAVTFHDWYRAQYPDRVSIDDPLYIASEAAWRAAIDSALKMLGRLYPILYG